MTTDNRPKEQWYPGTGKYEKGETLTDIFAHEVENPKMAWYVDYYTEDPARYQVRYLAVSPRATVFMTNENKDERDPSDLEGSQWGGSDVAEWFSRDGSNVEHRWVLIFQHASGEVYGLHVEANRVFAFGPASLNLPTNNLWEEYVEHGILGPVQAVAKLQESKLYGIIEDPDVGGQLTKSGLVIEYMTALAVLLDG